MVTKRYISGTPRETFPDKARGWLEKSVDWVYEKFC